MLPIIDHNPNSSGVNLLVTISVNTDPVITLLNPTNNAISPEYVTLTLLNEWIVRYSLIKRDGVI